MIVDTWQRYRDTLDSLLEGFQVIDHNWTICTSILQPHNTASIRQTSCTVAGCGKCTLASRTRRSSLR